MQLYVGTSGFAYKEWKGSFYPADLPEKGMLHYYAERLGTVEMNNTFFRMPKPEVLKAWAAEVPADFKFVLKASRGITHMKRLKNAGESVAYLFKSAAVLKGRLGPVLFQLPPNLPKDAARLRDFLATLPSEQRAAIEFRHPSWFDDEVLGHLRDRRVALCIADAEDGVDVPFEATASWGFLRLRQSDYTTAELKKWLTRVRSQKWSDAFIFFKHEDEGKGPKLARKLIDMNTAL